MNLSQLPPTESILDLWLRLSLITVLLDRQHSFAWRREPDFQRTGDEKSRNSLGEPLDAVLEQSGRDVPISIGLAFDDIARTLFNGPSPKHLVGSQSRQTIWNLELTGHPILLSGELSDSDSITFSVEYDEASLPDRQPSRCPATSASAIHRRLTWPVMES